MIIASVSNVTKTYPSLTVLDNIRLAIKSGEKIGFVGANGTGKTTLLEIIYGLIEPESGSVDITRGLTIKYLPQSISEFYDGVSITDMSIFDFIASGLDRIDSLKDLLADLERKIAAGEASKIEKNRYSEALHEFQMLDGYGIDANIEKVAAGLGFPRETLDKTVGVLSGGEKNRAALARLLIANPDLMLLDEPTNHLDIEGIEFLENYIASSPAAAVIVSHDRRFLDRTVSKIWEIYAAAIKSYPGNYTAYLDAKQKIDRQERKAYEMQQDFIKKTERFIQKNIAGQKTKQAQSRRKMLQRLERINRPMGAEKSIGIDFGDVARSERIVCKLDKVSFGYDSRPIIDDTDMTIERGDRIGLLGKNGAGKTTVIEILLGNLKPENGEIWLGKKLQIGYYRQSRTEFAPNDRAIDIIASALPELTEGKLRDYLGRFLFSGDDVFRAAGTFSGGQQSRLALAVLMAKNPNFLVLDEPTNHLDIPSSEALEDALDDYGGTLLVVSHDRFFLDKVVDKIIALENRSLKTYLGDYTYYETKKRELLERQAKPGQPKPKKTVEKKKEKTRRVNPIIINKIKDEIEQKETELQKVYNDLESSEYASDWDKLQELDKRKNEIEHELLTLYEKLDSLTQNDE